LNRDPIEEDGGYNLYAFVKNDGFNNIDYLGKFPPFFWSCSLEKAQEITCEYDKNSTAGGPCPGETTVRGLLLNSSLSADVMLPKIDKVLVKGKYSFIDKVTTIMGEHTNGE